MATNFGGDDRERIDRIRAAWEAYDNTGEVAAVTDYLADDVVLVPPGRSSIAGRDHVVEFLASRTVNGETDVDRSSERLFVSGDLAVDRMTVARTRTPTASTDSISVRTTFVHVYRRAPEGSWKCIISIWNDRV